MGMFPLGSMGKDDKVVLESSIICVYSLSKGNVVTEWRARGLGF